MRTRIVESIKETEGMILRELRYSKDLRRKSFLNKMFNHRKKLYAMAENYK